MFTTISYILFLFQLGKLDDPTIGTLPVIAFDILTIFFLQQVTPPVLPVYELPSVSIVQITF